MEQKIDLFSRARGLLNPLQWEEPFGMVMIEAMALGCPVISFVRGAAPEIVAHGQSGFLVQDVHEMVEYIPWTADLSRAEVRAHAEREFSAGVMAEKYLRIYRKLITARQLQLAQPKSVATRPLWPGGRKDWSPKEHTTPLEPPV
jgi:glycosyltransferase involved in cell wall biosynthesis